MNKNNLVHVKVGYEEALESKKDLLSLELNFVNVLKTIRKYKLIRLNELKIKNRLKRTTASALTNVRKIENALPKIKLKNLPKKVSREFPKSISEKSEKDIVLEQELRQIQEKLRLLQR